MKRGDIVVIDFPFSDGSGSKHRPALVVQADTVNASSKATIVASISTLTQQSPTSVVIDPGEESAIWFTLGMRSTLRESLYHSSESVAGIDRTPFRPDHARSQCGVEGGVRNLTASTTRG